MKQVSNPLTVIAIFAGISETISGLIIGLAENDQQIKYFLIGFPVLLVILFFVTLNFNSRVLYSPSDFKEDSSYLISLRKGSKKQDEVKEQLVELRHLIEPILKMENVKVPDLDVSAVRNKLIELEQTTNSQENARRFLTFPPEYQNRLLKYITVKLQANNFPIGLSELTKESGFSESDIQITLDYLENDWQVSFNKEKNGYILEKF